MSLDERIPRDEITRRLAEYLVDETRAWLEADLAGTGASLELVASIAISAAKLLHEGFVHSAGLHLPEERPH